LLIPVGKTFQAEKHIGFDLYRTLVKGLSAKRSSTVLALKSSAILVAKVVFPAQYFLQMQHN
jgi:hypothetical protein